MSSNEQPSHFNTSRMLTIRKGYRKTTSQVYFQNKVKKSIECMILIKVISC